jgi:hypothetical protein
VGSPTIEMRSNLEPDRPDEISQWGTLKEARKNCKTDEDQEIYKFQVININQNVLLFPV